MADYNSSFTGVQIDAALTKANSAVQPADLATVATTGAYSDLTGKPTLGTAAATASTDYATAAQGTLAASAVQPADDAADLGSGAATDGYVLTADGAGGAAWEAAGGGGGTPGGSDTQVQFNDGGAFGGDSGFTFDKTNNTLGLGGGTITASDPIIDMAQTWNNAAVAFTAVKANVTDTASAAGSLLIDLQKGGVSQFSVDNSGALVLASNTLEQRNGTSAQSFNLYNIYTNASNYERGFMRWASNALRIGAEKLGTGAARGIEFYTNGVLRADIAADGTFTNRSGFLYNRGGSVVSVWGLFGSSNYIGTETNHVFSLRTNNLNRIAMDTVGSVQITTALTVATLPATPLVGMMARVTDATSPTVGSTVAGGGSAAALCWYNGTNWNVIGA